VTGPESLGHRHPSPAALALYARSDFSRFSHLRVRLHLRKCGRCRRQVASIAETIAQAAQDVKIRLAHTEDLPGWDRLRQEMTGNIAVGLAAAQCIEHVDSRRRRFWIRILVACGVIVLMTLAWMTHIPESDTARIWQAITSVGRSRAAAPTTPVLSSTVNGLAVSSRTAGLKIITPASSTVYCSGPGTLRSAFIDAETGESTIVSVYGR